MLVQLASSKVLVASVSNPASTKTRVIEVGSHNYASVTLNLRDNVRLVGSPVVNLSVLGEGSNDGQHWATITGFGPATDVEGVKSDEGEVLFAFLRFDINMTVTGSAGDQAEVVFDLLANLIAR